MTSQLRAFAFQTGNWRVRHSKLVERLSGCTDWIEFGGTCQAYEVLDGGGNVDDFFIDDPAGAYRAATFRRMNPVADEWLIYWADARRDAIDRPMRGRFDDGVGIFRGRDSFAGRDIQVRFVWSDIGPDTARWEQAFSTDGVAWEMNWVMRFERECTHV